MAYIRNTFIAVIIGITIYLAGCESNDLSGPSACIPQAVNKKVLIEFFTNSGCIPCIEAHHYFDQITSNSCVTKNDTSVIIISFHTRYPSPFDSLYRANAAQNDRRSAYYSINSTPNVRLDGSINVGSFSASSWTDQINTEFNTSRNLIITLSNTYDETTREGTVNAVINLGSGLSTTDNNIFLVITENNVSYVTAINGITSPDDVVRTIANGQDGEPINLVAGNNTYSHSYTLAPNWRDTECYATVFIQSISTKKVYGVERIKIR